MIIGIVGSEAAKFTPEREIEAKKIIHELVEKYDTVCSGECHLGGIDIWAKEEALRQGKEFIAFPPKTRDWPGFKERNLQIASSASVVVCITVKDLPPGFKEGGWERFCYHCRTAEHIKSGGCWTVKEARKLGKKTQVVVV